MNKKIIFDYLESLIPNPSCELNFNSDYELLIAVMLSAQTTDKRVNQVNQILFSKYKSILEFSNANLDDIKEIIRPLGNYTIKANNVINICKKLVNENIKTIPNDRDFLESLPGVGRKTANVFLGIIYNEPCIAVDTHVARVSKRLGLANKKDSVLTIEKKLYKIIPKNNMIRIHHQLLLFGRYYCKAIKPICDKCKLYDICKEKKKVK